MKIHLFYTLLVIFAVTSVVTLAGITGVIRIADGYLAPLMGAFLIESAGAVLALFRRAEFFAAADPKHTATVAELQQSYAREMQHQIDQQFIASLESDIARMANDQSATHENTMERLRALDDRLTKALSKNLKQAAK